MAIVKFGPTVVDARGTLAGTIFSANKAGPYVRGWSRGSNPNSTAQTDQRGRFGALANAWADLTAAERDDWIDYADDPAQELTNSLGETYFASGFNWYIKINQNLEAAGDPRRDDAPTLTRPTAPILASLRFNTTPAPPSSFLQLDVSSPNLAFDHVVFARVTGIGRTAIAAGFRVLRIAVPDGSRIITLQVQLEELFGTIQLEQKLFIQIRSQDGQGQRSPIDTLNAESE